MLGWKPARISRSQKLVPTSERMSCGNDSDFQLRKSIPIFDSELNVSYSEFDFSNTWSNKRL